MQTALDGRIRKIQAEDPNASMPAGRTRARSSPWAIISRASSP